jgi:hypothetical protein
LDDPDRRLWLTLKSSYCLRWWSRQALAGQSSRVQRFKPEDNRAHQAGDFLLPQVVSGAVGEIH